MEHELGSERRKTVRSLSTIVNIELNLLVLVRKDRVKGASGKSVVISLALLGCYASKG